MEVNSRTLIDCLRFVEGVIYRADGDPYDEDSPQYDCYQPALTGDFDICDCWICDEHGNIHPGYGQSSVPVCAEALGDPVAFPDDDDA